MSCPLPCCRSEKVETAGAGSRGDALGADGRILHTCLGLSTYGDSGNKKIPQLRSAERWRGICGMWLHLLPVHISRVDFLFPTCVICRHGRTYKSNRNCRRAIGAGPSHWRLCSDRQQLDQAPIHSCRALPIHRAGHKWSGPVRGPPT